VLKVAVLTERRFIDHSQPAAVMRAMRDRGHEVRVLVSEMVAARPGNMASWRSCDVVVARGAGPHLLSQARWLEVHGIPVLNPVRATILARDRELLVGTLLAAGVPVPQTWSARPEALAGLPGTAPTARTGDRLLRLSVIGHHVWAVPRGVSARLPGDRPSLQPVPPRMSELALAVGRAVGLDLFSVDVVRQPDGPVVVGVDSCPSYECVPAASRHIADVVEHRAAQPPAPETAPLVAGRTAAPATVTSLRP
jgi:hypothetical protein